MQEKPPKNILAMKNGLTEFADNILNNRNLLLDKKILKLGRGKKPLNIYIANDMGFCGNCNTNVYKRLLQDENCDKIVIGKKILNNKEEYLLEMKKEEYNEKTREIEQILYDTIVNKKNSEINIIYNHYYNVSKIELVTKKILPIENKKDGKIYKEDFTVEGDINEILINIIVLYLSYEIKVAVENSYASENVSRQKLTQESLKKLDEIEAESIMKERKEKKQESFKKVVENFIKLRDKEGQ